MKKIFALDGSSRKYGNTSILLERFLDGAKKSTSEVNKILVKDANIEYCNGCLRCNLIGKCAIRNDDWGEISEKILDTDVLVFASPVYFHYMTAQLKKVIDRFRSFVHVQITEDGLNHTARKEWNKDFVLILTMGSSDSIDAKPVIELFEYMKEVLGEKNRLHVITANRLAVIKQILKTENELEELYPKLNLPTEFAKDDFEKNKYLLEEVFQLGKNLSKE